MIMELNVAYDKRMQAFNKMMVQKAKLANSDRKEFVRRNSMKELLSRNSFYL